MASLGSVHPDQERLVASPCRVPPRGGCRDGGPMRARYLYAAAGGDKSVGGAVGFHHIVGSRPGGGFVRPGGGQGLPPPDLLFHPRPCEEHMSALFRYVLGLGDDG